MVARSSRHFVAAVLVVALGGTRALEAQVVAAGAVSAEAWRARSVSVNAKNVALVTVLQNIAQQAQLTPVYGPDVRNSPVRVTLRLENVSVHDAFQLALRGTGLRANIEANVVAFGSDDVSPAAAQGVIAGKIVDAKTKRPIRGASVTLDGAARGVKSGDDGVFRISDVTPGTHRVMVRLLGYVQQVSIVNVLEQQATTVDFALDPSVRALDQVVVTGTVVATEMRALPNAITVVTAKQIEERGITRISQLFRGDVPGLFAQIGGTLNSVDAVTMYSRGVSSFEDEQHGYSNTNPIKTYVDGIQLSDPKYLSQIDPKNIERIEILSGPQASTIYGSDAINGVMQIFTKRGHTSTPQLILNLQSGLIESNFSPARTPQHDYNAQLSGVEGHLSYNAGTSWNYVGPWDPSKQTTRTNASAATRLELPTRAGRVVMDGSLRVDRTRNWRAGGTGGFPGEYWGNGTYGSVDRNGKVPGPSSTTSLDGQTYQATIGYTPWGWWSHQLTLGQDISNVSEARNRGLDRPSDTTVFLSESQNKRKTLSYSTTAQLPISDAVRATVVFGADAWNSFSSSTYLSAMTLSGNVPLIWSIFSRQPGHNRGGFLQAELGLWRSVYLTYGMRAEWNPNFGDEAQPNFAPRIGAAYNVDIGSVSAKLRFNYGRSTKPPARLQKAGVASTDAMLVGVYGSYDSRAANPELRPEYKQGGEGGLDLFFGNRASLTITRYNEVVNGLIATLYGLDSVRSLRPNPTFYGASCQVRQLQNAAFGNWVNTAYCSSEDAEGHTYLWQARNVNVADIRNQGWELQGNMNVGPFATRATYSWVKSRSIGVSPALWSSLLTWDRAKYEKGSTFMYSAEHVWLLGVTYARAQSSVALTATGVGQIRNIGSAFTSAHLDGNLRLNDSRWRMNVPFTYANINNGYPLLDLNASHRISSKIEATFQVQNLANRYMNDYWAAYASMGRQTNIGARLRL